MAKPIWAKGAGKKQADTTTDVAVADVSATGGDDVFFLENGTSVPDGGEGSDTYISAGYSYIWSIFDSGLEGWDTMLAGQKATYFYLSEFGPDSGIEEISAGGFGGVDIRGTMGDNVLDFSTTQLTGISYIMGYEGDDTITGSWGNNKILGGPGNDTLDGGGGNDLLIGGPGFDTFVFTDANDGVDRILDFTAGDDVIDLSGVSGAITFEQRGDDAALLVDGNDFAVFMDAMVADLM